jgi:hypothetical protein
MLLELELEHFLLLLLLLLLLQLLLQLLLLLLLQLLCIYSLLDSVYNSPGSNNADAFSHRHHFIIRKQLFGDLHCGKSFILSQNSVIILLCGSIS